MTRKNTYINNKPKTEEVEMQNQISLHRPSYVQIFPTRDIDICIMYIFLK